MQDDVAQWFDDIDTYRERLGQHFRDSANQSDKDAFEIAKLLIQSMILLHGSALVALPTFISSKFQIDRNTMADLVTCFSSGLVLALLAGVLAFFALSAKHQAYSILSEAADHRAYARAAQVRFFKTGLSPFQDIESTENKTADKLDEESKLPIHRFNILRWCGIILVLGAFFFLVRASFLAADRL